MVFQTFALLPWLTVRQNVELGLPWGRWSEVLRDFQLDPSRDYQPQPKT